MSIFDQLWYSTYFGSHNRFAVGHSLGNHPTKNLLPLRKLANYVRCVVHTFAKWILNQTSPCDVIGEAQLRSLPHVFFTVGTLAHDYKLNIRRARHNKASYFQQLRNPLLRYDPAYLDNYNPVLRNSITEAEGAPSITPT